MGKKSKKNKNNSQKKAVLETKAVEQVTEETITTSDTREENPEATAEKKQSKVWGIFAMVVVILLIISFVSVIRAARQQGESELDLEANASELFELDQENSVTEEVNPTLEDISEAQDSNSNVAPLPTSSEGAVDVAMTPVEDGNFLYRFSGIQWFLEATEEKTSVAFKMDNFSRQKSGAVASIRRPFQLGSFAGACAIDTTPVAGSLTSVTCQGEEEFSIGIFQNGLELTAERVSASGQEQFFVRQLDQIIR